jgi:hypothetical protein
MRLMCMEMEWEWQLHTIFIYSTISKRNLNRDLGRCILMNLFSTSIVLTTPYHNKMELNTWDFPIQPRFNQSASQLRQVRSTL